MTDIIFFLNKNGFKRMEENSYANDMCNVVLGQDEFTISDNSGYVEFIPNCLYALIGVLTYNCFINKNYKY